jgi:group I intron endonuclease
MNATENTECGVIGSTQTKNEPLAGKDTATKKIMGIYALRNKIFSEKYYVGKSIDIHGRWNHYYKTLHCKKQQKIYNALMKYGYDGFDKIILEECDKSVINEREVYWIKYYNCVENGYNLKYGGQGCGSFAGKKHTESAKEKLRMANLGKKLSDETKAKMSATRKGKKRKPFSDEWKNNIANGAKNRIVSEETRKKLSDCHKKRIWGPMSGEQKAKISAKLRGRRQSSETIAKRKATIMANKLKKLNQSI